MNGWKRRLESVRGAKSLLMYRSGKKYSREGSRTFNSVSTRFLLSMERRQSVEEENSARAAGMVDDVLSSDRSLEFFQGKLDIVSRSRVEIVWKDTKADQLERGLAFGNNERIVGPCSRDRFPIFLCSFTREYTLSKNAMLRSFFHRGNHAGTALSPRIGLRYRRFDPLDARLDTIRFDSNKWNRMIDRAMHASITRVIYHRAMMLN